MTVEAYFQSPAIGLSSSIVEEGGNLVKRCIIAIEGTHVCNQGKKYEMPASMIQELGENLNHEIANGRELALFSDIETGKSHSKTSQSKFGILNGFVECRPVTESDLPNPHARNTIGKMALFGVANIFKHIDLVKSGAIKALSPGIDMGRKLIFEVSAVPIASMPGVALFRSPYGSQFGYREIKEGKLKYEQHRDDTIGDLDALITGFVAIDRQDGEQMGGGITQKIEDFEQFVADIRERFGIPTPEEQAREVNGISYASSPYDQQVIRDTGMNPAGFSMALDPQEKADVLTEAAKILVPKLPSGKRSRSSRRSRGFSGGDEDS